MQMGLPHRAYERAFLRSSSGSIASASVLEERVALNYAATRGSLRLLATAPTAKARQKRRQNATVQNAESFIMDEIGEPHSG